MTDYSTYHFEDDGSIPNNPDLPLLLYSGALSNHRSDPASVKELLNENHWEGVWINGIYSYHHYHSTAHEVLVVTGGSATVMFGGERGEKIQIQKGDAVVIPAGVGHCKVNSSMGFRVVGAYPAGQNWDLCRGKSSERPQVMENIKQVSFPECDPITGNSEPLLTEWQ